MIRLSFTAEALTPLVIAGAAGTGAGPRQEGLRPPSLRGVMRFWFRAMMGAVVGDSSGHATLRELESRVFGSTEAGSSVRIRTWALEVADGRPAHLCMNDQRLEDPGHGVYRDYRRISKPALEPRSRFAVQLEARTLAPLQIAAQSLWLTAALGGVGNRARRGFGSLSLDWGDSPGASELREVLPDLTCPDGNLESIAEWLQSGVGQVRSSYAGLAGATPSRAPAGFSTLSRDTARLWLVTPSNGFWCHWTEAMDALREDPYRGYKSSRRMRSIGKADPRLASPLIIQIKRTSGGKHFGVLLAFENAQYLGTNCCHLDGYLNRASSLTSVEIKLP